MKKDNVIPFRKIKIEDALENIGSHFPNFNMEDLNKDREENTNAFEAFAEIILQKSIEWRKDGKDWVTIRTHIKETLNPIINIFNTNAKRIEGLEEIDFSVYHQLADALIDDLENTNL